MQANTINNNCYQMTTRKAFAVYEINGLGYFFQQCCNLKIKNKVYTIYKTFINVYIYKPKFISYEVSLKQNNVFNYILRLTFF